MIIMAYPFMMPLLLIIIKCLKKEGIQKKTQVVEKDLMDFQKIMKLIIEMENFIFKKLKFIKYYISE